MKKLPLILTLVAGLVASSCSKKSPEITKSIPDEAFLVASVHPKKIYDKGQISTMDFIFSKTNNELLKSFLENPENTGIDIDEYAFLFVYFMEDHPIMGVTAAVSNTSKLESNVQEILKDSDEEIQKTELFNLLAPDNDKAAMAWTDKQVIFLSSPDQDQSTAKWESMLTGLYELSKENSVTSIVDFNDFSSKMEDLNVWFTGDELRKVLEESPFMDNIEIDLPLNLYNNYGQFFVEFDNGAAYMHSETHLSDDVSKAADMFLVAKDELNKTMLDITPGNDLLMATALSLDLQKMVKMVERFAPPELDSMSGRLENFMGVSGPEIIESLSGDFVLAVNGAPEGSAIPVEVLIGLGVNDEKLQEKMMENAQNWASVQKDGDFFMINSNGMELYSGIVDGFWVITNVSGYKEAITGSGLEKSLKDSKFSDFSKGSMGMYMNLDISTYPPAIQGMLSNGQMGSMMELITETFSYYGLEGSNMESDLILKTAKDNENSLFTLLKMIDKLAQNQHF